MKSPHMIPALKRWAALAAGVLGLATAHAAPTPAFPHPANNATSVAATADLQWSDTPLELISNGGFETGTLTNWTPSPPNSFLTDDGTVDNGFGEPSVPPFAGNYSAMFITTGPGNSVAYHQFTIPANAGKVTLRWVDIYSDLGDGNFAEDQRYRVQLRTTGNTPLATLFETEPGAPARTPWTHHEADLTPFAGQTVRLAFIMTIGRAPMTVHWDSVSVRVEETPSVAHEIYFGTNSLLTSANLQGTTADTHWPLATLRPNTTYYWRIISSPNESPNTGPVWRFTTGPLGPFDHFAWNRIPADQTPSRPIGVILTAQDAHNNTVTQFNQTVSFRSHLLNSTVPHRLLGNPAAAGFAGFQAATVGYSFTPSSDIAVTHVRHISGEKVSIWTDTGILLASQPVFSTSGVWRESPLDEPLTLLADHTYRIGVYSSIFENHFARFDASSQFTHGTIHQSYESLGDGFPAAPHGARWWLVDFSYIPAATAAPLLLAPSSNNGFFEGVWSGTLLLPSNADALFLTAETDSGQRSASNPLFPAASSPDDDGDGMPNAWETEHGLNPNDPSDASEDLDEDGASNADEYAAGTDPTDSSSALRLVGIAFLDDHAVLRFLTVAGKRYVLERSTFDGGASWTIVGEEVEGTGETAELTDPIPVSQPGAIYRLLLRP